MSANTTFAASRRPETSPPTPVDLYLLAMNAYLRPRRKIPRAPSATRPTPRANPRPPAPRDCSRP